MRESIARRGASLVVIGSAPPESIKAFREQTGYDGTLLVDPSLRTFRAVGLAHGVARTFHPLAVPRLVRAMRQGFRAGKVQGSLLQQGGTFVLGPGDTVRWEWRDGFSGDHPDFERVLATLDGRTA